MAQSRRANERRLPAPHHSPADHARRVLLAACTSLVLVACSQPEPPEKERPPEPRAAAAARPTELRDAIQAPQDKARAVQGAVDDAAKAQRDAIEAAGG